jgi:hypothetical protein
LVNALINAPVCASGDAVSTVVPTEIRYASEASAALVRRILPGDQTERRDPIPAEQAVGEVAGTAVGDVDGTLIRAEIGVPRELLTSLVLIDTPAVGEPRSEKSAAAFTVLSTAHVVLVVSDATGELSSAELSLIKQVRTWCPSVLVALTKIDLCADWRLVAERDRALLAEIGVSAPVVPVSAVMRSAAANTGDVELNAQSGFPDLLSWLAGETGRSSEEIQNRVAAVAVRVAAEELTLTLKAGLAESQPRSGADQLAAMRQAQVRMDDIRRHTTRWQNLLSDETADLVSDIEYDLRERTRKVLHIVDRAFDELDPARVWDEFALWLEEALTDAIEVNYRWLTDRAEWIAHAVAETFPPISGSAAPQLRLMDVASNATDRDDFQQPRIERFTLTQRMFTGLRGSYGGVLMFGLVTSLAGLTLINPISLSAGAVFAAKTIRDEGDARLKRRQSVAKSAAQRHVDDVFLRFSKECRDLVRATQRRLRDHFSDISQEMMSEVGAAQAAVQSGAVWRDRRGAELKQEMARVAEFYQRAGALISLRLDPGIRELTA